MKSTAWPLALIAGAIVATHYFSRTLRYRPRGLGMLATVGIQLAVDAYGPIA